LCLEGFIQDGGSDTSCFATAEPTSDPTVEHEKGWTQEDENIFLSPDELVLAEEASTQNGGDFDIPFASDQGTDINYWSLPVVDGSVFTQAFNSLDTNGNGYISEEELLVEFSPSDIAKVMAQSNGELLWHVQCMHHV
jgi:hypothetical protein